MIHIDDACLICIRSEFDRMTYGIDLFHDALVIKLEDLHPEFVRTDIYCGKCANRHYSSLFKPSK